MVVFCYATVGLFVCSGWKQVCSKMFPFERQIVTTRKIIWQVVATVWIMS